MTSALGASRRERTRVLLPRRSASASVPSDVTSAASRRPVFTKWTTVSTPSPSPLKSHDGLVGHEAVEVVDVSPGSVPRNETLPSARIEPKRKRVAAGQIAVDRLEPEVRHVAVITAPWAAAEHGAHRDGVHHLVDPVAVVVQVLPVLGHAERDQLGLGPTCTAVAGRPVLTSLPVARS